MFPRGIRGSGLLATAMAIAACNGSGGQSQGPYDLQAAMAALVRAGLSSNVTLSGSVMVNGIATPFTGTGTLTLSSATRGTFNGAAALLQTEHVAGTVTAAGQQSPYDSSVTNAYDLSGTALLGETQSSELDVAPSPIVFPTAVGTTATALGTVSRYADQTLSVVLGATDVTVEVRLIPIDPGSPEVVQFTFKSYDANHTLVQTDNLCYLLTKDNGLFFDSASTESSAGTLTVTPQ